MLHNKHCDVACQSEECGYDGGDCICSEGCFPAMLGKCRGECLNPACDYDSFGTESGCRDELALQLAIAVQSMHVSFYATFNWDECAAAAPLCTKEKYQAALSSRKCELDCNLEECAYGLGFCTTNLHLTCQRGYGSGVNQCFECIDGYTHFMSTCTQNLPRGFDVSPRNSRRIYQVKDNTTEEDPELIYVVHSDTPGDGTIANPYNNIIVALAASWQYYTTINLVGDYVSTFFNGASPEMLSLINKKEPLGSETFEKLLIRSLTCDMEDSHPLCVYTPTKIDMADSIVLRVRGKVEFSNVIFTATSLFAGTGFNYCPYVRYATAWWENDRGVPASEKMLTAARVCNKFTDNKLFIVPLSSTLVFRVSANQNVKVKEFNIQPFAFVSIEGGDVIFENVHFDSIMPRNGHQINGFILQADSCGTTFCGTFQYLNGSVSYLNNGFDYADGLTLSTFVYGVNLWQLNFTNIEFKYNMAIEGYYMKRISDIALIYLENFVYLRMENCLFYRNFMTGGLLVVRSAVAVPKQINDENQAYLYQHEHIVLKGLNFTANFAENALIQITWNKELLNIDIHDCYFSRNALQSQYLVAISNSWRLVAEVEGAWRKYYIPAENVMKEVWEFPRHVTVSKIVFEDNSSFSSLLYVQGMANIKMTNIVSRHNGNFNPYSMIAVMSEYLQGPDIYANVTPTFSTDLECSSSFFMKSIVNFQIEQVSIEKNTCKEGGTGFAWDSCSGVTTIKDIFAIENFGAFDFGLIAEFVGEITITLLRFQFSKNVNERGSMICFNDYSRVHVTDSVFDDNIGLRGSILIGKGGMYLNIDKSNFTRNMTPNSMGGVLYYIVHKLPNQRLEVQNSEFVGNSADEAGCIAVVIEERGELDLRLHGNTFSDNQAFIIGAAISITDGVMFSDTTLIQDSKFSGNSSPQGVINTSHYSGSLIVANSTFLNNRGSVASCISIQTPSTADTLLSSNLFIDNLDGPVVTKPNSKIPANFRTQRCIFRNSLKGAISQHGGTWRDNESEFAFSSESAISLLSAAKAEISNSIFHDNRGQQGGGVYMGSSTRLQCRNCTFRNNRAFIGAAVYCEQNGQMAISSSEFKNNTAESLGSAIALISASSVISTASYSTFLENVAGQRGTIYLMFANIVLSSVQMQANQAPDCPGIVQLLAALEMRDSAISNQSTQGTAIMKITDSSTATISNSTFRSINATHEGGFQLASSILNITDCIFDQISSDTGAVIEAGGISTVYLTDVKFSSILSDGVASIVVATETTILVDSCEFTDYGSDGFNGYRVPLLEIKGSTFSHGTGIQGTAVYCSLCTEVVIQGSKFSELTAIVGGAVAIETLDSEASAGVTSITKSTFAKNIAVYGAAIYVRNQILTVVDSTFSNNVAESVYSIGGEGAGLYLDCDLEVLCQFTIEKSKFDTNTAERSGGAIAWNTVMPIVKDITMSNNSAPYGAEIASFPIQVKFDSAVSRGLQEIPAIPPGQPADIILKASLIDHYGNVAVLDNSTTAELVSSNISSITVSGLSKVRTVNGVFTFDDFMIYADPETTAEVFLYVPSIPENSTGDPTPHISTISLHFPIRTCVIGESFGPRSCIICGKGTYSFVPSGLCQICPNNAICLGNFTMYPESGYWRSSNTSATIWECPNSAACRGGEVAGKPLSLTGYCATGYRGNMCQSCDIGYSQGSKNKCGKCPPRDSNIARIILVIVAVVIIVAILVVTSLKAATKPKELHSIYLKIFMNYLQIVMLVTGFKLSWPRAVQDLFNAQQQAGGVSEQAYSFDCLLANNKSASDIYFTKIIFLVLLPILLFVFLVLVWGLIAAKKRKPELMKREMAASIVIVFFLIHPNLVMSLFGYFSCTEIDTGEYWLMQDMAIRCWNAKHLMYGYAAVLPAIILWVLAVPLVCLAILVKFRRRHDELWIKMQYGFLISGYLRKRFYWEFVILARKILIIICSVFINSSITIQALTVQLIILGFLILQYSMQPYGTLELNSMEIRAILVADVTIYCGLYYITGNLSESSSWFFFIVIIIVNVLFIVYWLRVMFNYLLTPLARAFPSIGHVVRPQVFEQDQELDTLVDLFASSQKPIAVWSVDDNMKSILAKPQTGGDSILDFTGARRRYHPTIPTSNRPGSRQHSLQIVETE